MSEWPKIWINNYSGPPFGTFGETSVKVISLWHSCFRAPRYRGWLPRSDISPITPTFRVRIDTYRKSQCRFIIDSLGDLRPIEGCPSRGSRSPRYYGGSIIDAYIRTSYHKSATPLDQLRIYNSSYFAPSIRWSCFIYAIIPWFYIDIPSRTIALSALLSFFSNKSPLIRKMLWYVKAPYWGNSVCSVDLNQAWFIVRTLLKML